MDTIKGVACTIHCKCQHCGKQNSIDQCFVEVSSYKLAVIHHKYDGEFTKETPYLSIKVGGVETIPVPAGWKTIDDCGCMTERFYKHPLEAFVTRCANLPEMPGDSIVELLGNALRKAAQDVILNGLVEGEIKND